MWPRVFMFSFSVLFFPAFQQKLFPVPFTIHKIDCSINKCFIQTKEGKEIEVIFFFLIHYFFLP